MIVTFDDAYAALCEYALPILENHGFGAAVFVVTSRVGATNDWDSVDALSTFPLMDEEQINTWAKRGVEFGAHTRTHPNLTTLDHASLKDEIAGSANDLMQLLGARPTSFAYPFGRLNDAAVESARENYDLAFATDEGVSDFTNDPHRLHRFMIKPTDPPLDLSLSFRLGWSPKRRIRSIPGARLVWRAARSASRR